MVLFLLQPLTISLPASGQGPEVEDSTLKQLERELQERKASQEKQAAEEREAALRAQEARRKRESEARAKREAQERETARRAREAWEAQQRREMEEKERREAEERQRLASLRAAAVAEMALIPSGAFLTDCDSAEDGCRSVVLSEYSIDRTEVTVEAYAACVNARACDSPGSGGTCTWNRAGYEQHPINCVDWKQANTFCRWRGKRLPTDQEWEKAARGADGRTYPWGSEFDEEGTPSANLEGGGDGFEETAPVVSFPSGVSPYGAFDMAGNVWEWTSSRVKWTSRSVRGGSWFGGPWYARASYRLWFDPAGRVPDLGFRCAQ
ncbi:SUMF1/EgtB/PvdO family nonheme iron enzyme [Myxococcota bacterium]|nr:SUMF1/EgtB/PvdO family nonheme iron enzyme [Myxococcota bacterium]